MRLAPRLAPLLVLSFAFVTPMASASDPPPRIEVAFALDATGSMGPYIDDARAKIRAIAADLSTGSPKPDVRFALVAYRDKGDAFVTKVHGFTKDVEVMHRALEQTTADGGGDEPESVLEGVRDAVTRLDWTKPSDDGVIRLLYVVGDAPPQHYPDSPTEKWIAAEANRRRISIHGIVCGRDSGETFPEFESMARHTEGRVFRLSDAAVGAGADRHVSSISTALTGTTKAYSRSIGVDFAGAGATPVATEPLAVPTLSATGLAGSHVRWVRDASTWSDVWAAHTSLSPAASRPPVPAVDFERQHVLVLGGSDGGLTLEGVSSTGDQRAARVRPAGDKGVRFFLVPAKGTAR
jgi:hypothetical protein